MAFFASYAYFAADVSRRRAIFSPALLFSFADYAMPYAAAIDALMFRLPIDTRFITPLAAAAALPFAITRFSVAMRDAMLLLRYATRAAGIRCCCCCRYVCCCHDSAFSFTFR